jgi:hypothetical protein
MKVEIQGGMCLVTREPGDLKMRSVGWGAPRGGYCNGPESQLLYHVKKALLVQGYDVIKKRMWKDGHLVDEDLQYIRTRDVKAPEGIMVWNGNHQIYDAGDVFNKDGKVWLHVDRW